MMDHARHVCGSTRSRRIALSQSATPAWHFQPVAKSAYKTQTKCRQNHRFDFSSCSSSTTYNFSAVKCLHFSQTALSPLPWKEGQGEGQTRTALDLFSRDSAYPPVRRLPILRSFRSAGALVTHGKQLRSTVQNRTKRNDFQFLAIPTTSYQQLTTTLRRVVRFSEGRIRTLLICPAQKAGALRFCGVPCALRLRVSAALPPYALCDFALTVASSLTEPGLRGTQTTSRFRCPLPRRPRWPVRLPGRCQGRHCRSNRNRRPRLRNL
jgi:hypothetical protein